MTDMCITKEEMKEVAKAVFHEEMLEFIPVLIAKGIKEADLHMKPSKETTDRLERLEEMTGKFNDTLERIRVALADNSAYHQDNDHFHETIKPLLFELGEMKPILESIKIASDGWTFILHGIQTVAFTVGGLGIIFGAIYAVKEWIIR